MSTHRHTVQCSCYSPDHHFVFMMDDDPEWDDTFLFIHLRPLPFWERVKAGIKYILGYTSKYGCFDEVCMSSQELDELVRFINKVRDEQIKARTPGVPKEEWSPEPGDVV